MDDKEFLSLKTSVAIPGLQSVVSAAWWFLAMFGMVSVWNFLGLPKIPAWAVGVVAFSVIGVVTWRALVDDWRIAVYGVEETYQEPVITQPVRIEIHENNNRRVQLLDLPARPDQLRALGEGITQGVAFSESSWIGPDGVFTNRREWCVLRDELIKRGFCQWKSRYNNQSGVLLTRGGEALMRHFAAMSELPTLEDY